MERVELLWTDETGTPRIVPGTLEDKSRIGVSIRVKEAIVVGSVLEVKTPSEQFSGIVTNCRLDGTEYVAGIRRENT